MITYVITHKLEFDFIVMLKPSVNKSGMLHGSITTGNPECRYKSFWFEIDILQMLYRPSPSAVSVISFRIDLLKSITIHEKCLFYFIVPSLSQPLNETNPMNSDGNFQLER